MLDLEVTRMNIQKFALGFIIFFLFAACLIQTSMLGCSKTDTGGGEVAVESETDGPTFFSRLGSGEPEEMYNWTPVSENVMDQVGDMFEGTGIGIERLERGQSGTRAIRCILEFRSGVSSDKQLYDGIKILHDTYPGQNRYYVGLSGRDGEILESDWDTMVRFVEEKGYTFDTSAGEAENLWHASQPEYDPDEETGENPVESEGEVIMPTIQSG